MRVRVCTLADNYAYVCTRFGPKERQGRVERYCLWRVTTRARARMRKRAKTHKQVSERAAQDRNLDRHTKPKMRTQASLAHKRNKRAGASGKAHKRVSGWSSPLHWENEIRRN